MSDVRPARAGDLLLLGAIEDSGRALFEEHLGDLTGDVLASPAPTGAERSVLPGFVLVAGDPVVGFVHVVLLDTGEGTYDTTWAHLEQLSVLPSEGRRGIGSRLVRAAMAESVRRGFDRLSLCTYADLPWNGPFYRRLGFAEVEPTGHLADLRAYERSLGLDVHGRRVAMRADLEAGVDYLTAHPVRRTPLT